VTDQQPSRPSEGFGSRIGDQAWLVAGVWLIFLAFPVISIWNDDLGLTRQLLGTAALAAYAAVYLIGFVDAQRWFRAQRGCHPSGDGPLVVAPRRYFYLAGMAFLLLLAYLATNFGVLGAASFIVAFAVFNLTWVGVAAVTVATIGSVVLVPALVGEPVLGLLFGGICLMVLLIAGFSRLFDENQLEQAKLETDLAVSEERSRLARDVHDVIGHNLTATILKVELSRKLLEGVEGASAEQQARLERGRRELEELEAISRRSLAEIRATISGIRTADLVDELDAARAVLADAGVAARISSETAALGDGERATLAWVVREAVTNVVRHAEASECHIDVGSAVIDHEPVLLRIVDDGVGFTGHEANGLRGLRERLEASGLTLRVTAGPTGTEAGRPGTDLRVLRAEPDAQPNSEVVL
jgi:two-component system sensor histidine kinase DesK